MSNSTEYRINDFLNSNACMWLMGAVFLLCSGLAMSTGHFAESDTGSGLFYQYDLNKLTDSNMLSWLANATFVIALAWATTLLNKVYAPIRAVTKLYASMFMLLQLTVAPISTQLNAGTLLCAAAVLLQFVLFGTYERQGCCQHCIYITFALLATCCLFQWAFVALMVAYAVGFLQIRSMSVRGVVAMLLGIVTPLWIGIGLVGLGIIAPVTAALPDFSTQWMLPVGTMSRLLAGTVAGLVVLTLALTMVNSFTFHNYRRQPRVYNYFLNTLSITAVIMVVADCRNIFTYVPLLNWCLGIHLAHAFTINHSLLRRYIPIVAIILAGLAVWTAQMLAF